jgi:uncharacterized protein YjbI with pentapeptide repeats
MRQSLNFANQDLRDRSFKGRNLIGADFSGADIRGCNFCRAQLKFANFANVKSGLSDRQILWQSIIAYGISIIFAVTVMVSAILGLVFIATLIANWTKADHNLSADTLMGIAIAVVVIFAVSFAIAFMIGCNGGMVSVSRKQVILTALICLVTAFCAGFLGSPLVKMLVSGAFKGIANSMAQNVGLASLTFLAIQPLQIFGSLYLFQWNLYRSRTLIGTQFQYADLSNASFYKANLICCDFSHALTTDVNWQQALILRCKSCP